MIPVSLGIYPVNIAPLAGPLRGMAQYAFVNLMPCSASLSIFGVETSMFPVQLIAAAHCWSVMM